MKRENEKGHTSGMEVSHGDLPMGELARDLPWSGFCSWGELPTCNTLHKVRQQPITTFSLRFLQTEPKGSLTPVTTASVPNSCLLKWSSAQFPSVPVLLFWFHFLLSGLAISELLLEANLANLAPFPTCKSKFSCVAEKGVKITLRQSPGGRVRIWKDYRLGVSGDRQEKRYGRNQLDTKKGHPMAKFTVRKKLHRRVERFFVAMSQAFLKGLF